MWKPILLLTLSNLFMTFAWYGHLKTLRAQPLYIAILVSWGIAFFEYVLQVPANRIGYQHYNLGQLKVIQEIITMVVFGVFSVTYMQTPIKTDFYYATACLIGAAYFMFRS